MIIRTRFYFFYSLSALSALPIYCANIAKSLFQFLSPDKQKAKKILQPGIALETLSYALLAISLIGIPDGYNAPSEIVVSWCLFSSIGHALCVFCDRSIENREKTVLFRRQDQPPSGPGRGATSTPKITSSGGIA